MEIRCEPEMYPVFPFVSAGGELEFDAYCWDGLIMLAKCLLSPPL
jgi:hypothetical protein